MPFSLKMLLLGDPQRIGSHQNCCLSHLPELASVEAAMAGVVSANVTPILSSVILTLISLGILFRSEP